MSKTLIKEFFSFKRMLGSISIKAIYPIVGTFITAMIFADGLEDPFFTLLLILGCNLLWRIFCEFIVMFYEIHRSLTQKTKDDNRP